MIVEDLGMRYNEKFKRNMRWCIFECPECYGIEEKLTNNAKRSKRCKPCGDLSAGKTRTVHGDSKRIDGIRTKSRLLSIWSGIKQRCSNPHNDSYSTYGAIGVTMCKEWLEDYPAFKQWSEANGYTDTLVLDKDELCIAQGISPKRYSPDTCQWVTREHNTRITATKLTTSDYKYIQDNFVPNTNSYAVLANKFHISERHIYHIIAIDLNTTT